MRGGTTACFAIAFYEYTSLGYLTKLRDTNGSGTVRWQADERDAELHLKKQTLGNSVQLTQLYDPNTGLIDTVTAGASNAIANFDFDFDAIGNLTKRKDGNANTNEAFCYDSLNRLTNYNTDVYTGSPRWSTRFSA